MNTFRCFFSIFLSSTFLFCSLSASSMTVDFEYPSWYSGGGDPVVEQVGLEWLRWDITNGMTIDAATQIYAGDGWRLASNVEMSGLLNEWGFYDQPYSSRVAEPFDDDENTFQSNWDPATHTGLSAFENLFGLTSYYCDTGDVLNYEYYGCSSHASALFGQDLDGDGLYNLVDLHYIGWPDNSWSTVTMGSDVYDRFATLDTIDWTSHASGVALVRDIALTPVPLPSSLGFFAFAIFVFGFWKKRRLKLSS